MKLLFKITILSVLFLLSSCVKDIDFNQANDLELTPAVAVSLVKFNLDQNNFIDDTTNSEIIIPIEDVTEFTALDNKTAQENLVRILFQFEAINTFERDFTIDFTFLDENDVVTHTIPRLVITSNDQDFSQDEEITIINNPAFLNSRKIHVRLTLLPSSNGSTIDPNTAKVFTFKSSGIFYFRID